MPAERRLSTDRTLSLPWSNSDALHCLARDCGGKPQVRVEDSKMGRNQSRVLSGKRSLWGRHGDGRPEGGSQSAAAGVQAKGMGISQGQSESAGVGETGDLKGVGRESAPHFSPPCVVSHVHGRLGVLQVETELQLLSGKAWLEDSGSVETHTFLEWLPHMSSWQLVGG